MIAVRYEDLLLDPAATRCRMCEIPGEEIDEAAVLRFRTRASAESPASLANEGEPLKARLYDMHARPGGLGAG